MGEAILGCRWMKSGLGVNGFVYVDEKKVLTDLDERRRIDEADEITAKPGLDLHHTDRNTDESARAEAKGRVRWDLIFEIVFDSTLIGSLRHYPIGLARLMSDLGGWSNGDGPLCNRGSVSREHAGLVPELVMFIVHCLSV